jgi:hypothetical protein
MAITILNSINELELVVSQNMGLLVIVYGDKEALSRAWKLAERHTKTHIYYLASGNLWFDVYYRSKLIYSGQQLDQPLDPSILKNPKDMIYLAHQICHIYHRDYIILPSGQKIVHLPDGRYGLCHAI